MAKIEPRTLPDYENPPIVEVVCNISFAPLAIPTTTWGLYWSTLQPDFVGVREAPPLDVTVEIYPGEQVNLAPIPVFVGAQRQMFTTKDQKNVIQVQANRFIYNWRKASEDDVYSRFENIYKDFSDRFEKFASFLSRNKLNIAPQQFELTYLNHIFFDKNADALEEFEKIIPSFSLTLTGREILDEPDTIVHRVSFRMPEKCGRLYITVKNGSADDRQFISVELTARGFPPEAVNMNRDQWFSLAREWIVRGFTDFTGNQYQKDVWGRIQ